jgi:hypothetical protein
LLTIAATDFTRLSLSGEIGLEQLPPDVMSCSYRNGPKIQANALRQTDFIFFAKNE